MEVRHRDLFSWDYSNPADLNNKYRFYYDVDINSGNIYMSQKLLYLCFISCVFTKS